MYQRQVKFQLGKSCICVCFVFAVVRRSCTSIPPIQRRPRSWPGRTRNQGCQNRRWQASLGESRKEIGLPLTTRLLNSLQPNVYFEEKRIKAGPPASHTHLRQTDSGEYLQVLKASERVLVLIFSSVGITRNSCDSTSTVSFEELGLAPEGTLQAGVMLLELLQQSRSPPPADCGGEKSFCKKAKLRARSCLDNASLSCVKKATAATNFSLTLPVCSLMGIVKAASQPSLLPP